MANNSEHRVRYGEAFWRAHHEAWKQSSLNQREYCEAHRIPLKAFGNWRATFTAEPQPSALKILYRRGGLSHTFSHRPSHRLSHMTKEPPGPIVPPAREGHRRSFSEGTSGRSSTRRCGPAPACRRSPAAMALRRVFSSAGGGSWRPPRRYLSQSR